MSYTFRLGKVVRDGVYESMLVMGQTPHARQLEGEELIAAADAKMREEMNEIFDGGGTAEEFSDLLEAVRFAIEARGLSPAEVYAEQLAKRQSVGGFSQAVYVDILEVPDGDPYAAYYLAQPERFPLIGDNHVEP